MAQVWKYPIPYQDEFAVDMPRDAQILWVGTQNNAGQFWARVDPDRGRVMRTFRLRGTGHDVDPDCVYVGTFMVDDGTLVFHMFEVI